MDANGISALASAAAALGAASTGEAKSDQALDMPGLLARALTGMLTPTSGMPQPSALDLPDPVTALKQVLSPTVARGNGASMGASKTAGVPDSLTMSLLSQLFSQPSAALLSNPLGGSSLDSSRPSALSASGLQELVNAAVLRVSTETTSSELPPSATQPAASSAQNDGGEKKSHRDEEGKQEADSSTDTHTQDQNDGRNSMKRGAELDFDSVTDPEEKKRLKRMAKNRATAAASRERKKVLLQNLGERVAKLEADNKKLQEALYSKQIECELLRFFLRQGGSA